MNDQEQKMADRAALKRGYVSIRRLQARERILDRAERRARFAALFPSPFKRLAHAR